MTLGCRDGDSCADIKSLNGPEVTDVPDLQGNKQQTALSSKLRVNCPSLTSTDRQTIPKTRWAADWVGYPFSVPEIRAKAQKIIDAVLKEG